MGTFMRKAVCVNVVGCDAPTLTRKDIYRKMHLADSAALR